MQRNLIITGLPRSGTSFLCAKLNTIENTVVLNEPVEIPNAFRANSIQDVSLAFSQYRKEINEKKPIPNKIKDGKFIEDTAEADERAMYIAEVKDDDFLLGMKNTLIILSNLHRIRKAMPHTLLTASIRNPYDTIGSWRNVSFSHMNTGQPKFLLNMVEADVNRLLTRIINLEPLINRQAQLWNFLAKQILRHRNFLQVIQYEKLVTNAANTLAPVCDTLGLERIDASQVPSSKPRSRHNLLSKKEKAIIHTICGASAARLGYELKSHII